MTPLMQMSALAAPGNPALGQAQSGKGLLAQGENGDLLIPDEVLAQFADGLGLTVEELPAPLLGMLQQWLQGGEGLPGAAKGGLALPQQMPQLQGFAQVLAQVGEGAQQDFEGELSSLLGKLPSEARGELNLPAKPLTDAVKQVLTLAADARPEGQLAPSAAPQGLEAMGKLLQGGSPTQSFSQVLANNLLGMGIPQRVSDPGWGQAMADRLAWMVKGDQQFAELKITPPNLGTLEVKLTINNDQASVAFVSNHAAVRDAIEAALPRLREMLAQESLNLAQVDVGDGRQGDGAAEQQAGQGAGSGTGSQPGDEELPGGAGLVGGIADASGLGLIDLFV